VGRWPHEAYKDLWVFSGDTEYAGVHSGCYMSVDRGASGVYRHRDAQGNTGGTNGYT